MKRFLGIVSLLYSFIIIYVWASNILKNFLAPNMQIYLKLSLIPLLIIGIVLLFNDKVKYKFKISDFALILPLIFLFASMDGVLSLSLADNRSVNIVRENKISLEDEVKEEDEAKEEEITYDFTNVDFDVIDETYNDIADYLINFRKAFDYEGMTIRVKGFTLTSASYIPKSMFMIGKYKITCCAADAGYSGYFAKMKDESIKLENRTWYQVEGVLRRGKDNDGFDIMYIEVINIEKIDSSKEEAYVYPCYQYGDGSCKETLKYNFDYNS